MRQAYFCNHRRRKLGICLTLLTTFYLVRLQNNNDDLWSLVPVLRPTHSDARRSIFAAVSNQQTDCERRGGGQGRGPINADGEEDEEQYRYLLNYDSLLGRVQTARTEQMEAKLLQTQKYYGPEHYSKIFYNNKTKVSHGRTAFSTSPQAWDKLKETFQIKILTMQQQVLTRMHCGPQDNDDQTRAQTKSPTTFANIVFAAAGHSSAAGHGNFEKDSYAAVASRAIQPVFESIGMRFESRNYGMTAMASGPELALCMESIYGTDVDVLSWDFGITDQRDSSWMLPFWMMRAAIEYQSTSPSPSPSSTLGNRRRPPALLGLELNAKNYKILTELDQSATNKVHALAMNEDIMKAVYQATPDTFGMTQEQANQLPDMLRYFKCNGFLETGDLCHQNKFDMSACSGRFWIVRWHPGYKRLAIKGVLLAHLFVEVLQDAIQDLSTSWEQHHDQQTSKEDGDGDDVSLVWIESKLGDLQSTLPVEATDASTSSPPWLASSPFNFTALHDVEPEWLYQSPSICRTAKLPAQIRYKGILTGQTTWDRFFREGTERQDIVSGIGANESTVTSSSLLLAYDTRTRQTNCHLTTNIDFADFFYVTRYIGNSGGNDWTHTTLPSDAELQEYGHGRSTNTQQKYHGIIILCPIDCGRDTKSKCKGDEILPADLLSDHNENGNENSDSSGAYEYLVDIQVNRVQVTAKEAFGKACIILSHHERNHIFPANDQGRYDLAMRINSNVANQKANEPSTKKEGGRTFDLLQLSSILIL